MIALETTDVDAMKRVNQNDFYQIGAAVHPLTELKANTAIAAVFLPLFASKQWMDTLLLDRGVPLRVSRQVLHDLRARITTVYPDDPKEVQFDRQITGAEAYWISDAARKVETVMAAELQTLDTYFIEQKGAFSTSDLIERAEIVLPASIRSELPEFAIHDIRQAGRALVLDLPTAAGFHVLRATESVIRRYLKCTTGDEPKKRDWGSYVEQMRKVGADDKAVATIDQIRSLHRNPLMHPEEALNEDDALVLFGIAQSAIVAVVADSLAKGKQGQLRLALGHNNEQEAAED